MGASFKEDCPDIRNSKVADIVDRLREYNAEIEIWDPWVSSEDCARTFGIASFAQIPSSTYDGIVVAVGHREFREIGDEGVKALTNQNSVIYDVKGIYSRSITDGRF